jgi:hypothetical protein
MGQSGPPVVGNMYFKDGHCLPFVQKRGVAFQCPGCWDLYRKLYGCGLVHPLVEVSGYYNTGHPFLTTQSKFISNNHSHTMTLPLQDQTTEAARRDSGTTKAVAVDGSASSKYIKW